jgi:hypothetical protein
MAAALGGEAAYANRNIAVSESGQLIIGEELRNELRQAYTDEQINGAADCTPASCGRRPSKLELLKQLRRQCVYRKADAAKASKFRPSTKQGVF